MQPDESDIAMGRQLVDHTDALRVELVLDLAVGQRELADLDHVAIGMPGDLDRARSRDDPVVLERDRQGDLRSPVAADMRIGGHQHAELVRVRP